MIRKKETRLAAYAARCIDNELLMYLRSKKKMARRFPSTSRSEPTRKEMRSICSTSWRAEGGYRGTVQPERGRGAAVLLSGLGIKRAGKNRYFFSGTALAEKQNTHRNRSLQSSVSAGRMCRGLRKMRSKNCVYGLPLRKCLTFQTDCFYNKG